MRLTILLIACLCESPLRGFEGSTPTPSKAKPEAHWAFQMPVSKVASLDEAIYKTLERSELKPNQVASRQDLIRRAYFVTTGLMPDQEERAKWLQDPRPEWLTYLVDDLLARPAFGERWARHWLDVVRYADTKGAAIPENSDYPFAYTYRDWVISSFNNDLPYNEFIHRQIAADLMDLPREELAALGFLTVGRGYQGGRRELVIADQIDVATRGVMGLTVACARCHDHKNDPITTGDFYALHGMFASADIPKKLPLIAEPDQTAEAKAFYEERKKLAMAVHDFVRTIAPDYQTPSDILDFSLPGANDKLNQTERGRFRQLTDAVTKFEASSPHTPPRAMVVRERPSPVEAVIFERGNPGARGAKVPRAFLSHFRDSEEVFQNGSGRLEFAHRLTDQRNPLTARVWVNRVWMHLMGSPLVDSPGDFGVQTPKPLQLEALDFLAVDLAKNQWSTKKLIRQIITSKTWQQSSFKDSDNDPENRFYARANRIRKDLEAWRDTTLQASGRLSNQVGGKPFRIDQAPYTARRTVYGKIERGFLPSIMRAFDFPSSEEALMRRTSTTTPTQALYLMNSPFLHHEARAIASKKQTVRDLYQAILQRTPTSQEEQLANQWMARAQQERTAGLWDYGYLREDNIEFFPLPRFDGTRWLGKTTPPDSELGWLQWSANGGHPELELAAALKWTAIETSTIRIQGQIKHSSPQGNGVRARVQLSDGQVLGQWTLEPNQSADTQVDGIQINKGQSLLFIVDSRGDQGFDTFQWAPKILDQKGVIADAKADFAGPGLEPLAQLAQALILSNEFFFID